LSVAGSQFPVDLRLFSLKSLRPQGLSKHLNLDSNSLKS
jgi:hypothetical protein